jgi:molybdate transport system substrate-binding protein
MTMLALGWGVIGAIGPAAAMAARQGEITVFAAASLTDVFKEIAARFEQATPGAQIRLHFAGSASLRTQLAQGARADVFATADELTMRGAEADGSIAGIPRIFAQNHLVVIAPGGQSAAIATAYDLATPGIKLVLAHQDVPVGHYARQALAKMSHDSPWGAAFVQRVLANVASNEMNVRQVVAKVQLGEADAGIVYATDVTPAVREALRVIEIPRASNIIARYPIAAVKGTRQEAGARAFIDYVRSPAAQAILTHHGFSLVDS